MNIFDEAPTSLAVADRPDAPSRHIDPDSHENGARVNKILGRRALVVEDDISLAGFLCGELEAQGLIVEQVHDGEEALLALEDKRRFDLLILDLNLPKLDGISLIQRLRPSLPKLPVL